MASPYRINLPVYEGPLDLLLDLIRKQEMDIHNIPIAKVTEQYLDYLHQLEKLDIDVSADFIYMAATLIHIKSKMLLPADPLAGPDRSKIRATSWSIGCSNTKNSRTPRSSSIRSSRSRTTSGRSPTQLCTPATQVEGELVVSLVDLVKDLPADPRAPQGSHEIRAAPRERHHRADDGPPAPAPVCHRGSDFADRILRGLRNAQRHDRRAAGRAGNGAHAGGDSGAVRPVRGHSACASTKCSTPSSPGPTPCPKSRSNICSTFCNAGILPAGLVCVGARHAVPDWVN